MKLIMENWRKYINESGERYVYKVKERDNLTQIANKNNIHLDTLKSMNQHLKADWDLILPGQNVYLPKKIPGSILDKAKSGSNTDDELLAGVKNMKMPGLNKRIQKRVNKAYKDMYMDYYTLSTFKVDIHSERTYSSKKSMSQEIDRLKVQIEKIPASWKIKNKNFINSLSTSYEYATDKYPKHNLYQKTHGHYKYTNMEVYLAARDNKKLLKSVDDFNEDFDIQSLKMFYNRMKEAIDPEKGFHAAILQPDEQWLRKNNQYNTIKSYYPTAN